MALPREIIDQIRERTDILEVVQRHVTLKRKGASWLGLCPFHQEKTPSFNVVPSKGIYHCFGCGEGGDVFKFLMRVQGLSFMEAVRDLAGPAGIVVEERHLTPDEQQRIRTRATLHDVCEAAAAWFQQVLLARPEGAAGRAYLEKRAIQRATIERFRIGYAPALWTGLLDHLHARGITESLVVQAGLARRREQGTGAYDFFRGRVMFPILDERQRVLSFGGRLVEEEAREGHESPKYFNGVETEIYQKQRVLFGLPQARGAIQREGRALLVEGYFDVVSLSQAGIEEAVATCGTALTSDQLKLLRRLTPNVVALFDSDQAGIKAAVRALPLFAEAEMEATRLTIPGAKDPDELIREHGEAAFRALLSTTEPLVDLVIRWHADQQGASPLGKQRALAELAPLIARFPEVARAALVQRAADLLVLPEFQVARQVRAVRTGAPTPNAPRPSGQFPPGLRDLIWLLLHFRERVVPRMEAVDPSLISDNHDVLDAIAALMQGQPLPAVAAAVQDEALRALLLSSAATEGLYLEERVDMAVDQILARHEIPHIEQRLSEIHRAYEACRDKQGDEARALLLERTRLTLRRLELKRTGRN